MNAPPPPRLHEWLASLSLDPHDRQAVLGDLAEEFSARSQRDRRAARRWYRRQVLTSIGPNLRRRWQPELEPRAEGARMGSVLQDLRFGWRMARKRPLVTVISVASLVVGMGAAIVVFGLLNAVLFRPLPVSHPDELAVILERREGGLNHNFSYQDFVEFRGAQQSFTDLVAYEGTQATLGQAGGAEVVGGELVSGSFFPTLGVAIRLGRGLTDADDRGGAPPVVVVSDGLWRRLTNSGDRIEERTVALNRQAFTIVGVAAPPFRGMQVGRDARFWAPLRYQKILDPSDGPDFLSRPTVSWLTVMGRLKPGVTTAKAADDLNRLEAGLPKTPNRSRTRAFTAVPGRLGDSMLPEATASPLQLLLLAAALVLLVACANVAGLLLARGSERARELAVRAALGASRARLVRLLLAEALMLGAGSAALALTLAAFATRLTVPLVTQFGSPVTLDVSPDWRVVAFAAALGIGATAFFGLVPIAATLRREVSPAFAETSRGASAGRRRGVLRRGLVVLQFALSLALVVVATLLGRTLYNLRTMPTGFDLEHVAVLEVDPSAAQYQGARVTAYLDTVTAQLGAVPGVRAVGYARVLPLDFGGSRTSVTIDGYQPSAGEDMEINFNRVSVPYFEAMGLRPIDGRVFDGTDVRGAPGAAVINETMARRYWPGGRAVGRVFRLGPDEALTVVGVVPDVKYRTLREEPGPSFYLAAPQLAPFPGAFHVRTSGSPAPLLDTLRQTVAGVDAAVPVTRVRTLREQADLNVSDERLAMTIALSLAGAALLLAAVGLFAAMSYAVTQRTREIGVRIALGAVPGDVRRLLLGQGLALAAIGSAAGAGLGLVMARTIEARLYGVEPTDLVSLTASAVLLGAVALAASWLPARQAARVDPIQALRAE
jgi:putative ABC transport system permease protein